MIGVATHSADFQTASEFFELFKTPWERAVPARKYAVVLSTDDRVDGLDADVFLVYGSGEKAVDRAAGIVSRQLDGPVDVEWKEATFPVYGRVTVFDGETRTDRPKAGGKLLDCRYHVGARVVRRIGYDLFDEIRHLLTEGQPVQRASTPTLELHIALLRHLLLDSGVTFAEIPARPHDYDFICCLTHDVDFFGIRRHRFDRTLAGFVARASVGTLTDLVRGRRPAGEAIRNWAAVLSLPMIFSGLARDFWGNPFRDYGRVENGRRSTFFLVPFKHRPGTAPDGTTDASRAVPYQASEIREELTAAAANGAEIGVHGIDAWRDADAGRAEMRELTAITGRKTAGVRMHWLYFGKDSAEQLEAAGFDYDSTWGYNDAVGYRAGTSQVFRLRTSGLMELPLSIMDSALFYSGRMGLAREEALQLCRALVANARRFGGTLVINWHCRSLAPERLWGAFYQTLLKEIGNADRAWFATAQEAVEWFRWRRSIRFAGDTNSGGVTITAAGPRPGTPSALVRVHRPSNASERSVEDFRFDGLEALTVQLS